MKKTRKLRAVNAEASDDDTFFVGTVGTESNVSLETGKVAEENQGSIEDYVVGETSTTSDWSISLSTNGGDVRYKLDNGEQINILPNLRM